MTVMDKISGWEDDEWWVRSKFAACTWIYTKRVLTGGQNPTPEMEEHLKQRLLRSTFNYHEWASESTSTEQGEEVMGKDLVYEISVPCVVQWCMLWFSAPTWLNLTLRKDLKNQKLPRSRGQGDRRSDLQTLWEYTHSENVNVGIGGLGFFQNTQEMESEKRVGRIWRWEADLNFTLSSS